MIRKVTEPDVSTVLETVRSWPERARRALVDGVLATLETPNVTYLELSAESNVAREDLACADQLIRALDGFRHLDEDWDGAGASPPSAAAIESAENWIRKMCRDSADVSMPDCVAPGVDGEVVIYWQRPGLVIEATINGHDRVEWMETIGESTRHFDTDIGNAIRIDT